VWSTTLGFRVEDVDINNVQDFGTPGISEQSAFANADGSVSYLGDSAQQILDQQGGHFITSIKPAIVRDTTDSRIFPTTGNRASVSWEQYGAIGGELTMSKIVTRFDWYYTLSTDIFNRKTVLAQRNEFGFIPLGTSEFYERFYGGGIGSLRGFKFRGAGPVSGPLNDPVGGDFSWFSTVEVNRPIYEEIVRGVAFVDMGTVETDIDLTQLRMDAGFGLRLTIPFFGQLPLAIDFAYPIMKAATDQKQYVSFSLGIPF
jgi:outer membrane protein insertion porin family